jgi:hypothetical protein
MKSRIQILLVLCAFAICTTANAQDDDKNISITVSGSGKTLDDAKQSALRSAIEQAYGSFISSKTEILNDQVVADQMASVSSGNIKSYDMLNESQLPGGTWGVTLKAVVSISKLTSFVQSKGIAIEIKGSMFALNIKQQLLNEQGEIKAVCEMVGLLHEPMQISFDYTIKSGDPKSMDNDSKNWEFPLVVTATTNKNMDFCANYCFKTLEALSLSAPEVESYKALNKAVFPVWITNNGQQNKFYLRKRYSIKALSTLISQWEFYVRGFSVQSGMAKSQGNWEVKGELSSFGVRNEYGAPNWLKFLERGIVAGTFSWKDKKTLAQIEQMTGYTVKSLGIRSQFKHGGFVVYEPFVGGYHIGLDINDSGEVVYLEKNGPASLVGVNLSDKIININNFKYTGIEQLKALIANGDRIKIDVLRNSETKIFEIKPFFIKPFKGLVSALMDVGPTQFSGQGTMNWVEAKQACDNLVLNGYDDWQLPSPKELSSLYYLLNSKNIGGFQRQYVYNGYPAFSFYWSSSENDYSNAWAMQFDGQDMNAYNGEAAARAVRYF